MKNAKACFLAVIIIFFLSLGFNFFVFSPAAPASAQTLWDMQSGTDELAQTFGQNESSPTDVRVFVIVVIKVALTLVAIIMIIMIIIAGVRWMTAGGNADAVSTAKNTIKNAVIGMAIIVASYMIVDFTARCVMHALEGGGIWGC